MRVIDLENINNAMRNETQFVLRCEEVYHDKISAAAASILSTRQERPGVAPAGSFRFRKDHDRAAAGGLSEESGCEGLRDPYG